MKTNDGGSSLNYLHHFSKFQFDGMFFNAPFTSLASRTGVRALTEDTLIVNSRFFDNNPNKVPTECPSNS